METKALLGDWPLIVQFLPENLSELAKDCKSVERWRNIKNGEDLLRIILAFVTADLSLRSTAGWATATEIAEMQDTSILHRLKKSIPLLEAVLAHLLNQRLRAEPAAGPILRLNDASVLSVPGSSGADWRIHATYDPVTCRLVRVQVTTSKTGESLAHDTPTPGEVVVADRGLAHAAGMHSVAEAGAYTMLRMHWQNIRLLDERGQPLELEKLLSRAENADTGTTVCVPLKGKAPLPARLIIRPLPQEAAEKARRHLHRNAYKKGRTPSALALRLCGYFSLLTTLPATVANDDVLCELYRIRWQIELFFKRLKSLLHLGQLRADDPELVRAWCTGKLIVAVLAELLDSEAEFFSPWGVPRRRVVVGQSVEAHTVAVA